MNEGSELVATTQIPAMLYSVYTISWIVPSACCKVRVVRLLKRWLRTLAWYCNVVVADLFGRQEKGLRQNLELSLECV